MAPVYSIETPENLTLSFHRAGLATRAMSLCVDVLAMGALLQVCVWGLEALELFASSAASALWIVIGFLVQWGYGAVSEWLWAGRTLGKRLFGIVVIDAAGVRITLSQAALRNLLRLADLLPGFHLLGACIAWSEPHGRRLGDLAARTIVVLDDPRFTTPARNTHATTRSDPRTSSSRVRVEQLDAVDRRALIALCDSLEQLGLAERYALCQQLATHLSSRYTCERPSWMSAETFLLLIREAEDFAGAQES